MVSTLHEITRSPLDESFRKEVHRKKGLHGEGVQMNWRWDGMNETVAGLSLSNRVSEEGT